MDIQQINNFEQWYSLQDDWDNFLLSSVHPSIFLSFDYLTTAWKHFHAHNSELLILILRDKPGDPIIGIAPFRITRHKKIGVTLNVLEYVATMEIDKPYIIVSQEYEETCWQAILDTLMAMKSQWDCFSLYELSRQLQGLSIIEQYFKKTGHTLNVQEGGVSPIIDLTETWDAFYARHRRLRQAIRKLEKLPEGFQFRSYISVDEVNDALVRYADLEALSWKSGVTGVSQDLQHLAFYQELLPKLAQTGRVAMRLLYSGNELLAGNINFIFGKTAYGQHTVYNAQYSNYAVGRICNVLSTKELMETRAEISDCLCGFSSHMDRYAISTIDTANIEIHQSKMCQLLVNSARWLNSKKTAVSADNQATSLTRNTA